MTLAFVLDASAAISWASPDEQPTSALSKAIEGGGAVAPAIWIFEVHNVLHSLRRRKRLNEQDWLAASTALAVLPIEIEAVARRGVEIEVVKLAQQHALTIYDASYLELALRRKLPLATLDDALLAAAKAARVKLI